MLRRLLPCRVDAVIVGSALKAIRELERGAFDLVVSDLEMPGLKGSELLRMVAERWPATRRMLVTKKPVTPRAALLGAGKSARSTRTRPSTRSLAHEIITATICRLATTPRNGKQQRTPDGTTAAPASYSGLGKSRSPDPASGQAAVVMSVTTIR